MSSGYLPRFNYRNLRNTALALGIATKGYNLVKSFYKKRRRYHPSGSNIRDFNLYPGTSRRRYTKRRYPTRRRYKFRRRRIQPGRQRAYRGPYKIFVRSQHWGPSRGGTWTHTRSHLFNRYKGGYQYSKWRKHRAWHRQADTYTHGKHF